MTMKSVEFYENAANKELSVAEDPSCRGAQVDYHLRRAQVFATLAHAAATSNKHSIENTTRRSGW